MENFGWIPEELYSSQARYFADFESLTYEKQLQVSKLKTNPERREKLSYFTFIDAYEQTKNILALRPKLENYTKTTLQSLIYVYRKELNLKFSSEEDFFLLNHDKVISILYNAVKDQVSKVSQSILLFANGYISKNLFDILTYPDLLLLLKNWNIFKEGLSRREMVEAISEKQNYLTSFLNL